MNITLNKILLLCFLINTNAVFAQEENLEVFQKLLTWDNPDSMLMDNLIDQANDYYDIRDGEIAQLSSMTDWQTRQALIKDKLLEIVGPFPEKTPLNPSITGTMQKDGYRVEKIIYESMPNFYVTGCLFIPDSIDGKVPAVLYLIGHDQESFRAELYQTVYLNLVKKGMIVLAIDPIGQGEHVQYYDPAIEFSSIGYTVIEHNYFGNQCFLSGISPGRYFIWDGIRGIDYLLTRDDVDPERIGVTGFSGGGTITSYISAFDDRVKVSVPCSWSTATKRQVETKGAGDAETLFVSGVAEGITFEDLMEVRAPKPALMTFTTQDQYLSIQGAREAFEEIKKAYQAFGIEDNLEFVEDDSIHWMTPKIRLEIYKFFMKHFDLPGDSTEEEVEILSEEDLTVTSTGQISTSVGGDMLFDVYNKETEVLINNLEESRKNIDEHISSMVIKAKEISGYEVPYDNEYEPILDGTYQRDGYTVGMHAIKGEGDYIVPLLLFVPDDNKGNHPALVFLHTEGKIAEALPGGEIEELVKKGYIVAATDVLGVGETENKATVPGAAGYTAAIIGRSVIGIQAADIVRAVNYLKSRDDVDTSKVGAVAVGEICLPLIHAAAFDPSIDNISLISSPISYRSIAMNRFYKNGFIATGYGGAWHPYNIGFSWGIASVLTGYDLPDLIGSIAPRKVILAGLQDQMLEPASPELIDMDMAFPRSVYSYKNAEENLKIVSSYESISSVVDLLYTGTIAGTVTDSITGNPIEGVTVTDGTRSDSTDNEGNYTLTDVPVDTITITALISDYLPYSVDSVVVAEDSTIIVDFQLSVVPTGTISGIVTDAATGYPVQGAAVSNGTSSDTTDAGGNYTLSDILVDTFTITASKSGYIPLTIANVVVIVNDTIVVVIHLSEFPDLVGYWRFEESSGTTAYDSSENNNDGIIYGPTSTSGKLDLAFQFDGTDDYVTIPRSASLDDITDEITLIAWIKIPAGSRYSIIERWLFGIDVEERSFVLDIKKGQVWFGLSGDGTSNDSRFLLSSNTLLSDTWTHVEATSDGSTMKIYINGVLDPESNTSPSSIHPSAADVHIGKWEFASNQSNYPFDGTMDEVKIYNRALSAQEVEEDYNLALVGIKKNLALENGLLQAYPNPINNSTTIGYTTTVTSKVGISIYNLSGQKIRDLVDETQPADNHSVVWDRTDATGEPAGSGIYFCTFSIDDKPVETKKLVLLQ